MSLQETKTQETMQWNPDDYNTHARFVSDLAGPVLDLLAPTKGERILDLGCGDGVLTLALQSDGIDILGVDSSPEMVASAQARGVDAAVMNGQALTFDGEFDAIFSSAAMHWMPDVDAVIVGAYRALKPQGRFVSEFGGFGNVAAIRTALRAAFEIVLNRQVPDDGWVFPSVDWYRQRLELAGFDVVEIAIHDRLTPLDTDIRGWYQTMGGRYLNGLTVDEITRVIDKAEALVVPEMKNENGDWFADYKRLRFKAVKID